VVFIVGMFVHGEAFWLLPTLVLEAPASAVAGAIAAFLVYRASPTYISVVLVWLLTAAGAFVASTALTYAEFGVVTRWVAAPLVVGALVGAAPASLLARVRASERLAPR
jgi:hypothetical protein